jgi:ferredoxin
MPKGQIQSIFPFNHIFLEEIFMIAIVDKETCTGCELCIEICPDVFKMDGIVAVAYKQPVPETNMNTYTCREAAEECPGEAITIQE